jgi:hypothetical protein
VKEIVKIQGKKKSEMTECKRNLILGYSFGMKEREKKMKHFEIQVFLDSEEKIKRKE